MRVVYLFVYYSAYSESLLHQTIGIRRSRPGRNRTEIESVGREAAVPDEPSLLITSWVCVRNKGCPFCFHKPHGLFVFSRMLQLKN
jgi:hypothetical protein